MQSPGIQIATTRTHHGVAGTEMSQMYTAFAAPMKGLERFAQERDALPQGQPDPTEVWRTSWSGPTYDGGLKADKRRSHERIDAIVGLATALDGVIRQPLHTGSLHDTRAVLFF